MAKTSSDAAHERADIEDRERHAVEAIRADLEELRDDVTELAQALRRHGRLRASDLGAEATRRGHDLVEDTRDAVLEMRHSLAEAQHDLRRSVRSHPVPWAGVLLGMVGTGLLVALLMERRN
ncbi:MULTISPECIES: hypothetical protein [unclassified Thioclava]|uniref:hypothetical protein n=1 Tax=unclassified Thioclava TaxID=2621713 RepID=UPI0009986CC9|nr:hypothetical protein [Thioclava sp. DLFJ4-1]OOY16371.1 hypothetical protein BMI85_12830 [Thioclava sp. DLFJ4-1]